MSDGGDNNSGGGGVGDGGVGTDGGVGDGGESSGGMGGATAGIDGGGGATSATEGAISSTIDGDNGSSAAAATMVVDSEMNAPFAVGTHGGGNVLGLDQDHDDAGDRPPDVGYKGDRLATSSPRMPYVHADNPFSHRHSSLDLDDYFVRCPSLPALL